MSRTETVSRSIEFAAGPAGWSLILVGMAVGFLVLRRLWIVEAAVVSRRSLLHCAAWSLRIAALMLLGLLLAGPAIRSVAIETTRPAVSVLIDRSASVSSQEAARFEAWARAAGQALEPRFDIEVRGFSSDAGEALTGEEIREQRSPLAAILLLTDGRGFEEPDAAAGVPLFVLAHADQRARIVLSSIDLPGRVLVGDPVSLSARLFAVGLDNRDVELEVRDHDRALATTTTRITGDPFDERISIPAPGLAPGMRVLTLEARIAGDSAPAAEASAAIDVLDAPLRILYLECAPGWTYRFLKSALLRDSTLEVGCLLLEADEGFPQEASPGLRRLDALPERRALDEYDVVLLGEIDPASLPDPESLQDLRQFVEAKGGGLAFLGGAVHPPSSFAGTPLEDCLPAILADQGSGWTESPPFYLRLTAAGRASDLLRLIEDDAENLDFLEGRLAPAWRRPPGFTGHAAFTRQKPGAVVHATHPTSGAPLILEQRFGKGRVLLVGVDELWRWRFGVEELYFHRFFGQAIRMLADLDRLVILRGGTLAADRVEYRPGQRVNLAWRGPGAPSPAIIRRVEGGEPTRPVLEGGSATIEAGDPGLYLVGAENTGRASSFRVVLDPSERRAVSRLERLRRHAESTGGGLLDGERFPEGIADRIGAEPSTRRIDRGLRPLASFASFFWILAAVLGLEWTLRKLARLA